MYFDYSASGDDMYQTDLLEYAASVTMWPTL